MRRPKPFAFHLSGRLCLDFANTVSWRASGQPVERLTSYSDLVSWSRQTGTVSDREARRLTREGERRPPDAARTLRRAAELREALYRIFSSIADGQTPASADMATLNAHLCAALRRLRVVVNVGRYSWEWTTDGEALNRMLWPVARSAAEFLVSGEFKSLRKCAADNCGWLFVDTSRNRSRRWCDMKVCGNRAKVRRHYRRRKGLHHAPAGERRGD